MSESEPKFRREPAWQRRDALIQATLSLIAEQGVRGATVRAIAKRADVTPGLIRHHFSSKEDLITAAYERHMSNMTDLTSAPAALVDTSARERLIAFVEAALKPPVVDAGSVTLWASFLNKVREDARMREIHEQTYHDFRDRLEALISGALTEAGITATSRDLHRMAIACNAVIDGLWMEGGALPGAFEPGELPGIGVKSVGAIIGIAMGNTEGQS
jgi:AcrR family transcriptional regulator